MCFFRRPKPAKVSDDVEIAAGKLPDSFDWRSFQGQNFISPIRDQGECGSCYAFGIIR
jgi:cathepsin C